MQVAQSPNDLLFNLSEIRPKYAVKRFRKSIIEDYPGTGCAYCGRESHLYTLDHIVAKSRGGPHRRWNLARCCTQCNGSKSNTDVLPWWRPQTIWNSSRENQLFLWMKQNSAFDPMTALQNSLHEGILDENALEELKRPDKPDFFEQYCDLYPSAPECLIYDC